MIRAAMIGSGFIGAQHVQAYAALKDVKLVALADANEAAGRPVAEQYGCEFFTDAQRMFESVAFDYTDVCVPTFLHPRLVEMAAGYGKHVLCEKPFALSETACREMADVCRRVGVRLMVAQSERWAPHVQYIRRMCKENAFGSLRLATLTRLAQHPNWTKWHRDPEKSGGGLFDLQVHDIDLLISFFGEVEQVYAVGWKSPTGCWNHVCAELTFKNGVRGVSESSLEMTDGYPFTCSFRLTGDIGCAEYDYRGGYNNEQCDSVQSRFAVYAPNRDPLFPTLPESREYVEEIAAFADALERGDAAPIPVEESIYVIRVTEAIRTSLETGNCVRL